MQLGAKDLCRLPVGYLCVAFVRIINVNLS